MSDREIMNSKGFFKKMPINFDPKQPKLKNIDQMPDQKWHRRISFLSNQELEL